MAGTHWVVLTLAVSIAACSDNIGSNDATRIDIRIATSGASLDPDGYVVHLHSANGGEQTGSMAISGLLSFYRLPGSYTAELTDVSPNCKVLDPATRSFDVTGTSAQVSTEFDIHCTLADGTITVYTNLPASAGPGPFTLSLKGHEENASQLSAVDSTRFSHLADGLYIVTIAGAKEVPSTDPCLVPTSSVSVRVADGKAIPIVFPAYGVSGDCV